MASNRVRSINDSRVIPFAALQTTVRGLVEAGIIERPIDGNHGDIHPKGDDFVADGIPFIMASDVFQGRVHYDNCKFITLEQAQNLRKGFSKRGDVLITHKATLGRTAIVGELEVPFVMLTPQVTYYRVLDEGRLTNRYLKYYFDSATFQQIFHAWAGGGSTRGYLGITKQLDLPVVLPSIEEQRAIANILGTLDDKIELNRRTNHTLEEMTQAIFRDRIGGHTSKAEGEGSAMATLAELCERFGGEIRTGPFGTALNASEYTTEGIPVIAVRDIRHGYIELTENTPRVPSEVAERLAVYELKEGDIIFGRKGAVDRSAYISANQSGWLMGSDCIRLRLPKSLEPKVWSCGFRTPSHAAWMLTQATGTTMATLNQRILKSLPIPLPPENVLRRAADEISPLLDKTILNREESSTLANLRDALLPKLLSGDLRIDDPEKFLEENVP